MGRTVQYRRLHEVYTKLRRYIFGHSEFLPEVIEKAALPVRALLARGYHAPACVLLLAVYARVHYLVVQREQGELRLPAGCASTLRMKHHLRLARRSKQWGTETLPIPLRI